MSGAATVSAHSSGLGRTGLGVSLWLVQLALSATWFVYVAYLPQLLAGTGLPRGLTPWVLVADQLLFAVLDILLGFLADRASAAVARFGPVLAAAGAASALVFVLMPLTPWLPERVGSVVLLLLVFGWVVVSALLRAPALLMFARHVPEARSPWVAAASALGLGVASAASPILASALAGLDARIPFVLSSAVLLVTVVALAVAERVAGPRPAPAPATPNGQLAAPLFEVVALVLTGLLLGLALQLHGSFASGPRFAQLAGAAWVPVLMPVFWLGFSVAILPFAALLTRLRSQSPATLPISAAVAFFPLLGCYLAPEPISLTLCQLLAGLGWGAVFQGGLSHALKVGAPRLVGSGAGLWLSMLAVAALLRLLASVSEIFSRAPAMLAPAVLGLWCVGTLCCGITVGVSAYLRPARE